MSSLKEKSVKGIGWIAVEQFGQHGVRFIFGIILARLLTPEDFGLVGMVSVFFALAMVFVESGFSSAYIQKKEVDELDANTIFYFNIIVSFFVYLLLWISAPFIAEFYSEPQLIPLVRVMSIVVIINAFQLIQSANIARNVNFKLRTKAHLTGVLLGGVLGITAAYKGFGVWSLVIQSLTRVFIQTVLLWIMSKWWPRLIFSIRRLKEMFSFSLWILLGMIFQTFFDNIYILTIGKFFPTAQLGFYTKAKQLQRMPTDNIVKAIDGVAFPVLSKFQDDNKQMVNAIRKFLKNAMFMVASLTIILIVIAKPFVLLVLTDKWEPMIPLLQLLCVVGLLYPIHSINVRTLLAKKKSKLNFNISLVKNGLRFLNIVLMYRYSVMHIILGEMIISLLALYINAFYLKRLTNYGFFDQMKDIYKIILGSIFALLAGGAIVYTQEINFIMMGIAIIITVGVYLFFMYLLEKKLIIEFIGLIKSIRK
ncbi:MAG: lipopolysaccharide biosynthesis protein [bacterium]